MNWCLGDGGNGVEVVNNGRGDIEELDIRDWGGVTGKGKKAHSEGKKESCWRCKKRKRRWKRGRGRT